MRRGHGNPCKQVLSYPQPLSVLQLQEICFNDFKFKYFLLSRFSQDAIENLFSTIRLKNPVPDAKEFKTCLRVIIRTQFFKSGIKGSYFEDDYDDFNIFLQQITHKSDSNTSEIDFGCGEHCDNSISFDIDFKKAEIDKFYSECKCNQCGNFDLSTSEEQSLYYLCGCIVKKVRKRYNLCTKLKCF